MSYLTEAFKALDALNEETFDVSADGIKKLADFENLDDNVDETTIFDMDADTEDDIEDSYIGKVIIDCNVCHSKIYKDKDEVVIDDETNNANIDMECPYCYSTDGFKVIGEVAPMNTETEEKVEDDIETQEDSDKPTTETEENVELEESLNEATTDRVQNLLNIIDKSFEVSEDDFINEAVLDEDTKIRLSAIPGVTRDREGDFTDDGNRFQAYLYKGLIPITYLRFDGDVYITIAFHHLKDINYEEYKEFPSYEHANDFNGVSIANFDPQVFKKNLDAAYDDVTTFLGNVEEVDPQQLDDRIKVINKACKEYEEKVKQYIKDNALNIMKIPDYQFRELKRYVISASNKTADAIRDASAASKRDFMSTDIEKLKERISSSWNFKYIEDILNSVKESFNEATVTDYKSSLSNILVKNKDKISKMATKGEIVKFLDSITDEVRDKNYLETVKSNMQKKNDFGALQYIYGIILSGEGKGVKESIKENIGTDIDEYQQWVDYDMKRYGKISNQTNKEIEEAGLQVVKDKYGDYQVIAGKYDESLKETEEEDNLRDTLFTEYQSKYTPDTYDTIYNEIKDKYNDETLANEVLSSLENDYKSWFDESLKECVKDVTITTDDSKTTMTSEDDGKVTVTTEPVEDEHFEGKEVIKPLDDETIQDIETNSIDDNESEEYETVDEVKEEDDDSEEDTEFAENKFNESFSKLCENYLKENYSNVESFKATKSTRSPKQIIVEGLIKFTSGKVKNTKFSFNENISTKNHKGFQGKNLNITKDKAPFLLKTNSKMVCEALSYNYRTKNDENKKVRCKGIVKEG